MIAITNYLAENWRSITDLAVVYIVVYIFLIWAKNSPSYNLLRGLVGVLVILIVSFLANLPTLNWLTGKFTEIVIFLLIIVFQPEIRRLLDRLGSDNIFGKTMFSDEFQPTVMIKQLLRAVDALAQRKIGALIVIERSTNLADYMESGVTINGRISSDLLVTLFWPNTPTHDGAVIIRENRIASAGCLLPLTHSKITDRRLGTRHRAALGLSETTDALIIVISEETGTISLAEKGNLTRYLNKEALETRLFNLYKEGVKKSGSSPINFFGIRGNG